MSNAVLAGDIPVLFDLLIVKAVEGSPVDTNYEDGITYATYISGCLMVVLRLDSSKKVCFHLAAIIDNEANYIALHENGLVVVKDGLGERVVDSSWGDDYKNLVRSFWKEATI